LLTFKIKHLVTQNCVKDWGKVAPRQGWGRKAPGRVRERDAKLSGGMVRLGKIYLSSIYKDCHNVKVFSQGPLKLSLLLLLLKILNLSNDDI